MCCREIPLPLPPPDLVLWYLHADPSVEGHLASMPQLNQTYYSNQMKKVVPIDYCLDPLSAPIGEFHVGSMRLSCQPLGVVYRGIPCYYSSPSLNVAGYLN